MEKLSEKGGDLLERLRDVRWRSLELERKRLKGKLPSPDDDDGVLALFIPLHDSVGPKSIGDAMYLLDAQGKASRVNRVRYYSMKDFQTALLTVLKKPAEKKAVERVFGGWPYAPAGVRKR